MQGLGWIEPAFALKLFRVDVHNEGETLLTCAIMDRKMPVDRSDGCCEFECIPADSAEANRITNDAGNGAVTPMTHLGLLNNTLELSSKNSTTS